MSIMKQPGSDWSREKENGDNDNCNKCGCVMHKQDQNHDDKGDNKNTAVIGVQ